ncbi:hypothetical protein CR513_34661, partial [Mucuna pruriens]
MAIVEKENANVQHTTKTCFEVVDDINTSIEGGDSYDLYDRVEDDTYNPSLGCLGDESKIEMKFVSLNNFKDVVKDYIIYHERQIKWIKNGKIRAREKYKEKECKWSSIVHGLK